MHMQCVPYTIMCKNVKMYICNWSASSVQFHTIPDCSFSDRCAV